MSTRNDSVVKGNQVKTIDAQRTHPLVLAIRLRKKARKSKASSAMLARIEDRISRLAYETNYRIGKFIQSIEEIK